MSKRAELATDLVRRYQASALKQSDRHLAITLLEFADPSPPLRETFEAVIEYFAVHHGDYEEGVAITSQSWPRAAGDIIHAKAGKENLYVEGQILRVLNFDSVEVEIRRVMFSPRHPPLGGMAQDLLGTRAVYSIGEILESPRYSWPGKPKFLVDYDQFVKEL